MRKEQAINYLAIYLWDTLGNDAPTELQIKAMEQVLSKTLSLAEVCNYLTITNKKTWRVTH